MSISLYELETGQSAWFFGDDNEKSSFINQHNQNKRSKVKILTPADDYFHAPLYAEFSLAKRYHNSIKAIKTLINIESSNRYAIYKEQQTLSSFSSFAAMPELFDEQNIKFKNKRSELKNLVSTDEYNSLRLATLSAFYTPEYVVLGLKEAIQKSGFSEGRILDPASGTGSLMRAFDKKSYIDSDVSMIELDNLSSRINYALYPHATLYQNQEFEAVDIENNSQDLIISNPPFGEKKVFDNDRKHLSGLTLHNYFITRSVECLKAGGLFYVIVSTSFLDAKNSSNREKIAQQATLLHAIRLPKAVFEKTTGANASVDILLFTKDLQAEKSPTWINTSTKTCSKTGDEYRINDYYCQHPQNMLGEMQITGHFQGNNVHCIYNGNDLTKQVSKLFSTFPKNCFKAIKTADASTNTNIRINELDIINDITHLNTGSYIFDRNDDLYTLNRKKDGSTSYTQNKTAKDKIKSRIRGMSRIRDSLISLLHAEKNDITKDLNKLREQLNSNYDIFVKKYGYVTQGANQRAFKLDPSNPNLLALEVNFKDAKVDKKDKTTAIQANAEKAPIFNERVISPYVPPKSASTPLDALYITLNESGKVVIPRIADLLDESENNVISLLADNIFLVPNSKNTYQPKNIYLSGDVKTKLSIAKNEAKNNSIFNKNVAALERVIPLDIQPHDISIRCHSAWLPTSVIQDFIKHMLGDNAHSEIDYGLGQWHLKINGFVPNKINRNELGTKNFPATKVFESLYMGKELVVRLANESGGYYVDYEQTILIQSHVETIHTAFKAWVFSENKRTVLLSDLYNEKFNRTVLTNYDAPFLNLPTLNKNITPYSHQKRAIYRAITDGKLLADIPVGGGKTLIMCGIAEEWLRLGISKRIVIAMPNHLTEQFSGEYLRLFPTANVLCLSPSEFSAQKRKETLLRLKTGAASIVIVPETTLKKLPIPTQYEKQFIQEDIDEIVLAKEKLKNKRFSVKKLETLQENLKFKLKTLSKNEDKNEALDFESLGITSLMLDECQTMKNLYFNSALLKKCAGLNSSTGSKKSYDFYLKTRYLTAINKTSSRGIVLSTATPLSNSIIELHTLKRYLLLPELKQQNLAHLDQWVGLFAAATNDFEIAPTGKTFKITQRLREFTNTPEMISLYSQCAEVVTEEELEKLLPTLKCGSPSRPPIRSGKAQTTYLEPDQLQEKFMAWLVYRAQDLKNTSVINDNMLSVMFAARASSLDLRILNPSLPANPNRKAVAVANRVAKLYAEYSSLKGTQIIFCDLSVPKRHLIALKQKIELLERIVDANNGDSIQAQLDLDKIGLDQRMAVNSQFDVYSDIKALLMNRNIKENEIAFAQDYQSPTEKKELYRALNTGDIRVVIASTHTLGTGANVNKKLVGIQLVDPVYRPSDNTQRCGRGLRVGNEIYQADPQGFKGIDIRFYATIKSLDSFLFQTLSAKAKFIDSFRKASNNTTRTIKDIGVDVMTFEQIKTETSDNPIIKTHFKVKRNVHLLNVKFDQFQQNQINFLAIENRTKNQIETTTKQLGWCKIDHATLQKNLQPKDSFLLIDHLGSRITDHSNAAMYISDLILQRAKAGQELFYTSAPIEAPTFRYNGFEISIELYKDKICISMIGKLTYSFERDYNNVSASGIIMVLNNYAKNFESMFIASYQDTLKYAQAELDSLKSIKQFEQLDELKAAKKELNRLNHLLAKTDDQSSKGFVPPPFLMNGLTDTGIAQITKD